MIRKNIKLISGIGLLFFTLSSCSDYLSEIPDNRTQIDSEEKISELLVGAYPDGSYMQIAATRSDNFADKGNLSATDNLDLSLYSWEIPIDDQQDSPIFYWSACYKAIAQANQALASIEELSTEENPMNAQRGEGLLARAYAHFMLVNLWSEHYDPATSSSDLGIPYVTEPENELLKDYSRGTVEEVYENIEQDLLEGLELVENNYESPKFHFTPEAALAFATRFYLYKGEWQKVIDYSNQLLNSNNLNLRDWEFYNTLQYSEVENIFSSSTQSTNLLIAYTSSVYSRSFASSRFGLSNAKLDDLFSQNSFSNPTGKTWIYPIYGTDLVYNIPKFQEYFEYTNINAGIGFVHTPNVLFSYDEVVLARAEAYAMLEQYDNSLNDINSVLASVTTNFNSSDELSQSDVEEFYQYEENVFTPYYSLNETQTSFVECIAEIRRREYYFEGLRWFDIKRFHLEVAHDFINRNTDILGKEDNRRLLQIPQNALAVGIQPNPRN